MAKQNYNLNFSEAQDYITKRGLDVVWNDCDIFIDERHITESVANVLKWADEHPKEEVIEIKKYPNERMISNEEKSREISDNILGSLEYQCGAEEGAQEMAKWKDEQYRTAYVVTRSEEHSDYVETIFYDRDKAIEYCKPFNQNENSYGRDITILVDGEEKGIILSTDEIYKL